MKSMNDLFEDTIKDLYSAEKQFLKAMPKLMKASKHPELKAAIEKHIGQTEEQIKRLEQVAKTCGFKPTGKVCMGAQGIVEEGHEHIKEFGGNEVGDAALLACAQKNEHYEIEGYGTAITWAQEMGKRDVAEILKLSLAEEEETDKLLTDLAKREINLLAIRAEVAAEKPKAKTTATRSTKSKVSVM